MLSRQRGTTRFVIIEALTSTPSPPEALLSKKRAVVAAVFHQPVTRARGNDYTLAAQVPK